MKNEYPVTRKRYLSWTLESMTQKRMLIFIGILTVLGVGLICFGVANDFNLILIVMGVFCLYQGIAAPLVKTGKRYTSRAKEYGQKPWTRTVEFGEEAITVSEGTTSSALSYAELQDIWEKKDRILLVFTGRSVIRLYRDAFVDTTWEACLEKINQCQATAKAKETEAAAQADESEA